MCTVNQELIPYSKAKKGIKVWKICVFDSRTKEYKELLGLYNDFKWKKGENLACNFNKITADTKFDMVDESDIQIGFHCFKYKKDAINFVKNSEKFFLKFGWCWDNWTRLALIQVTLFPAPKDTINSVKEEYRSSNIFQIRKGNNLIGSPIEDTSPCYVAPIAVWNGKYKEFRSVNLSLFKLRLTKLIN